MFEMARPILQTMGNRGLGLAVEIALKNKVSIPLGDAAYDLYRIHAQAGSRHLDLSRIIRLLKPVDSAPPKTKEP